MLLGLLVALEQEALAGHHLLLKTLEVDHLQPYHVLVVMAVVMRIIQAVQGQRFLRGRQTEYTLLEMEVVAHLTLEA